MAAPSLVAFVERVAQALLSAVRTSRRSLRTAAAVLFRRLVLRGVPAARLDRDGGFRQALGRSLAGGPESVLPGPLFDCRSESDAFPPIFFEWPVLTNEGLISSLSLSFVCFVCD